jgi:hypothetical protein
MAHTLCMSENENPADVAKKSSALNLKGPKPPPEPVRPTKVREVSDVEPERFKRQVGHCNWSLRTHGGANDRGKTH